MRIKFYDCDNKCANYAHAYRKDDMPTYEMFHFERFEGKKSNRDSV